MNRVLTQVNPLGQRTSFLYDDAGRPRVTISPLGFRTTQVYDTRGRVAAVINPLGNRTSFAYDADNNRTAVIADARNDENIVVAQLHLQFLKLHNKLIAQGLGFEEARTTIARHYQFIILTEFLPLICGQATVDDVVENGNQFYQPVSSNPFMPVEFSAAAYRFGHSMVRDTYNYNRVFTTATLSQLFEFTGISFAPIPSIWIADWRRFFHIDPGVTPNPSRAIDPFLASTLANLPHFPAGENVLALRNLIRGDSLGLPSGQGVASVVGAGSETLPPAQIATGPDGAVAAQHGLHTSTPLWYYILKEAQVTRDGTRLGPVGARLCAEVLVKLIQVTPNSILNTIPRPTPTLPRTDPNRFTIADLIRFVGEISPLDGI